ncbi:ATP-dependent DNA ligase [Rhodonellum sp.]|uniref:ATP-dependent DNA ligase n=1 Tax=Rhodonellum sp. TaxID=2231180 RepID=UPI00271D9D4A|nr:ATP-dependent DNA ligase [Rhodonellum sp.]MDO9552851.1 ATP-dependent DNA ligase [Rhodonellum sp.]
MKHFALLFSSLDQSNKTSDKLAALGDYFAHAVDQDRLWAIALFTNKRPKRQINTRLMREWCCEWAEIPMWLFEESYHSVGDLAETLSLLLPISVEIREESLSYWIQYLVGLEGLDEIEKKEKIIYAWKSLGKDGRFIFNKIITGGFRVGISQNLVTQAVANTFAMEKTEVAHRIMGDWHPNSVSFQDLILAKNFSDDLSRPYPFYLAYSVDKELEDLGSIQDWQIEWKWDGIRGQIIKRNWEVFVWSRGEELISEKFPELMEMAKKLPNGTVLDGEILAFQNGQPLPFSKLQTRIGRKNLSKKILKEAPVSFITYDILESQGKDIRGFSMGERRAILEKIVFETKEENLLISVEVKALDWHELRELHLEARKMFAEGFMLKNIQSTYGVGRKRGDWWKWKTEPLTIDGVVIYAQKGHGRRSNLYSDYTFGVWDGDRLIPFAKAYSGLTDLEIQEVDKYIKQNTLERFGPVRTVKPGLVFEIAFEGIQESPRHKSGIALRFPRIQRWRQDKPVSEANTLSDLKSLLSEYGG